LEIHAGTSFGGGGAWGVAFAFPEFEKYIVTFLCFCLQHFNFLHFAPPPHKEVGQNFAPPLEKTEMTSLNTWFLTIGHS